VEVSVLRGFSMRVYPGDLIALVGPSGSGKSTAMNILGTLDMPTRGLMRIAGRNVTELGERELADLRGSKIGFIFQQFNLIRDISVQENVALPCYPAETGFAEIRSRVEAMLARFGLTAKKNLKVRKLSGGEQQRVAIARALINDPEIIIADEPTAHLDLELAAELLTMLDDLRRDGRTIIIATHDPLIFDHGSVDRTISMRNGRIENVAARPQ